MSGKLSLSRGDFYLAALIAIADSQISLEGAGWSTVLRAVDNLNDNMIEVDSSAQRYNCALRNFRMNGNSANQVSGNGIDWSGMMAGLIENVYISHVKDDGIYANAFTLGAATSVANHVTGCQISDCGSDAIYLRYIYAWIIDGNPYLHATANGIYLSSCGDITIANNAMDQCRHGIYLYDSWRAKIIGNRYIGACSEWGIKLTGSADTNPHEVVIIGNGIAENVTGGIYVNKGNQILIADNHINKTDSLAQTTGIQLDSTCSKVRVTNNVLDNTTTEISNSCPSAYISGNQGYIAKGEVRSKGGSLTAGAVNTVAFYWNNPEKQDILVRKVTTDVTTASTDTGACIDIGIADSSSGTNLGTEFFDDLPTDATGINCANAMTLCEDSTNATDAYVVGLYVTDDSTALVGTYSIEYQGR